MAAKIARGCFAAALALTAPTAALAQATGAQQEDTLVYNIDPVVVTATRGPRELSRTPQPVSVIQLRDVERLTPNTVSDLFRGLPGLDVTGVGVNQGRPQIRGLEGQRILLLEDGLRLNNSRRQSDFGELPALVDVTAVQRVEVVRGPASVLYGSDAIGGVVNVITKTPAAEGLHGTASLRYGGVENQRAGTVRTYGRYGDFTLQTGFTQREADPYTAPRGSYGRIVLANDAQVDYTGTKDRTVDVRFGHETEDRSVWAKFERYEAEGSGFGSLNPALYAPSESEVRITYPSQTFNKMSAGYRASGMSNPFADEVQILGYGQENDRELLFGIGPFTIPLGPGQSMDMTLSNLNTTAIRSYGVRAEARKLVASDVLLTYGLDVWRDRAVSTDANTTDIVMYGVAPTPIESTDVDDTPSLPEASYLSVGAFLQSEVELADRLSIVAGGRWQHVGARTYRTPGLTQTPVDVSDGTLVGALNAVYDLGYGWSLVGALGRAFRSPNLIERFFDGPTPEGSGYQVRNPDLAPETSVNLDLGTRFRRGPVGLEAFVFHNRIADGIRIEALGYDVQGTPAHQMTNVDELVFRGLEVSLDAELGYGFSAVGSYTRMDTEDRNDAQNPVGQSFSSKQTASLVYEAPSNRFWAAFEARRNGERKDSDLDVGNPIGPIMPSFIVMNLRGGVTVWRTDSGVEHHLNVALTNLDNTLYAEFANIGFFRPEPKRNLTLSWDVLF